MDLPRKIALNCLYKIDKENAFSNIVLDEALNKNRENLKQLDIKFISELVYGVTNWRLTLDAIIQKYSKIKLKKMSDWVINILRLGAYQIVFLDKVPKSASVNESVNLCKKYSSKSTGFVNAILRKISKNDYEEIKDLSLKYSMPKWIINELSKEFDEKQIENILKNFLYKPKLAIRVNKLKTKKDILKKLLENNNIEVHNGILEDFLYTKNVKDITNLQEYKDGLFSIEDEAAGLAVLQLEAKENDKILDCCSAPGGKTTYIAELINDRGNITAWDLYDNRINQVAYNAERLGIKSISAKQNDALIFNENLVQSFDKILVDAPCLGLGILKRKPDIKWQKKYEDIKAIKEIQIKILENCSKYLKKGGTLIYSTCSIIKEENDDIVKYFLDNNEEFTLSNINEKDCKNIKEKIINKGILKIYPNENTDGFFIAKIERKL